MIWFNGSDLITSKASNGLLQPRLQHDDDDDGYYMYKPRMWQWSLCYTTVHNRFSAFIACNESLTSTTATFEMPFPPVRKETKHLECALQTYRAYSRISSSSSRQHPFLGVIYCDNRRCHFLHWHVGLVLSPANSLCQLFRSGRNYIHSERCWTMTHFGCCVAIKNAKRTV